MALGSNSGSPKIYLSVGFGKIRQKSLENKQKVDVNTPNAVKRLTKAGAESWALEHDFVSGIIENIFYKEDKEHGNSFEVVISDGTEKFQLSFSEGGQFCTNFLKKLPNVDLSAKIKITAYDFTDRENKRKVGVSLEQNGIKINSFYERKKEDSTWELLHGFPPSTGVNFKDDDEMKMYFILVKKFLRGEFVRLFSGRFENKQSQPEAIVDESSTYAPAPEFNLPESDNGNDLPF